MLTKENIKDFINSAGFDHNEYVLYTGAALLFHGIREETKDIDLGVTPTIFEALHADEEITKAKWSECRTFHIENVEFFELQDINSVPSEFIDGIRVQTLDDIIRMKELAGREKDLRDIELIKQARGQ